MPGTGGDSLEQLIRAVKSGKIDEEIVDRRVDDLLDVVLSTTKNLERRPGGCFDIDEHHAAARSASEQSIVLLKNEESMLPLKAGTKVAVKLTKQADVVLMYMGLDEESECEGLYVGYRYYDKAGMDVLFPFGFGLSYTTFKYSNIKADTENVTFTITNTGNVDGAEIAEV